MPRKEQLLADAIFLIHDLLSPEECARHVAEAEGMGFAEAGLGGSSRDYIFKEVRDNARVIHTDAALSEEMYRRVAPFLPADWFGWRPVGLNECWRYYRYDPGQRF